ncbi:MAG: chromosome segregation protein [Chloroflexi bacterium]|nr:MAG: chromosome segregation protein [Chloroflexota bacterium]
MHFKRFEIQGYKSFATRTQFAIDPGITAVVGPNGSGKSNIMDALRWIIGETTTSQMRAKRMEDVIFAGSESRAPAGLAEARIVLDNADHWLPLDAEEVEVVRRVHRSGDSEFRINDNRVRLRDIQELFSQGGLGPGSHALMGQGLVEDVLRLKPEERRGMIEDVADVRRHRLRMISSRRKREAAEENLARARLLIDEIAPRMRTVERQAKRAIQHAELNAELHAALIDHYGREWRRLTTATSARRAAARERAAQRQQAEAASAQAEQGMERWRAEVQQARERLEAASAERRRLAQAVRELESKREIAQQRRALLDQRATDLESDVAALRDRTGEPDVGPSDEQRQSVEAATAAAAAAVSQAQATLAAASAELAQLRRRRDEADAVLARLDREQSDDERRLAESTRRIAQIQAAAPQRESDLRALAQRLAAAQDAAQEAGRVQAQSGVAASDTQARRAEIARDYNLAAARLRDLESARSQRERDLTRANDRLQMLRELQAESEGMHQGLRALFGTRGVPRDGEPTGIPGVVGVLRHLLHAPRGLEQAIEAALGDYLDAVLFESSDKALSTMRLLVQERAGRIMALPLDDTRDRAPLALPSERGVIGVASEIVRCRNEYRGVVDTLLGRTVVVEDVETGRDIVKRGLGEAVTRDGYLMRPNGALSGGRLAESGSFTRENELRSLPTQIEELQRSLAESADVAERTRALQALAQELTRAEEAAEEATSARARAQEATGQRRADVAALRGEAAAIEQAIERAQAETQELSGVETEVAASRAGRSTPRQSARADRPNDPALLAATEAQAESLRALGAVQALQSAAQGEQRTLDEAERTRRAEIERTRIAFQRRQAQLAAARAELTESAAALATLDTALAEATQRRDALLDPDGQSDAEAASQEAQRLQALLAEEPGRRDALARCQRSRIEAEKSLVAADAVLREVEAAVERLREQIASDELTLDDQGRIVPQAGATVPTFLKASAATAGVSLPDPSSGPPAPSVEMKTIEMEREPGAELPTESTTAATTTAARSGVAVAVSQGPTADASRPDHTDTDTATTTNTATSPESDPPESDQDLRERIETLRGRLRWLGTVNPEAAEELEQIRTRHDELSVQVEDLEGAERRMLQAEAELATIIDERFSQAYARVDTEFQRYFRLMFRGGSARLVLTDEADMEASGVEIVAQPPGKRVENLNMLSGGERSLTAIALLFALLEVRPAPFCVLDEVDAALDEANVSRFVGALKELAQRTQFVVITHNRRTIEQADSIYGITMGEDSVSRVLSVRLTDLNLDE